MTTLAHPNRGWNIASGTWNALRTKWGLTSETLQRIYDSKSHTKIKGWWRTGEIRVKQSKKMYECWVKNKTKVPLGAQDTIITVLQAPNHNFGKDEYAVDMTGHETHYWQGTESGLLGAFELDQRTLNSRKVGREDEGLSSTRPELVALAADGSAAERSSTSPNHPTRTSSRKS